MRYTAYFAIGVVGWALAIVGIASQDAGVVFGGVALVTIVSLLAFLKLERAAQRREHHNASNDGRAKPPAGRE